jgi:hypothetical protein
MQTLRNRVGIRCSLLILNGGHARNRTGVHGFAVHAVRPHHQGLSRKLGHFRPLRRQWVSRGLQTAWPPPDQRNAPQDAGLGGVPKDRMKVQLLPAPYATAAQARQATATDNTPTRTPLGSFERPKRIKNETADAIARRNKRAA